MKRWGLVLRRILTILGWMAIGSLILWVIFTNGTGFGPYLNAKGDPERGKTLWDWLGLLIVPTVLAVGGLLFARAERKAERDLASQRSQEAALQSYFDKMTQLLLHSQLRESEAESDSEVQTIARARTLAVLRVLDGERKGLLLRFLDEAELIDRNSPLVSLGGADLSNANLRLAKLYRPDLSGTNLSYADLRDALLEEVDLSNANLHLANLRGAYLLGADFSQANLAEADLSNATLYGSIILPDGGEYTADIDMKRFTDPGHSEFWRSRVVDSPAFRGRR